MPRVPVPISAWPRASGDILLPLLSLTSFLRPVSIGGSALVRDYLSEVPAALDFFAGSPRNLDSYKARLRYVSAHFTREDREKAARALAAPSREARQRLDRFVTEGGAMVTTGQQAGFLAGPLYTVYKALSAVVLARHLEQRLGQIVLPVFWAATEDHDWAEINHTFLLDPAGRLRQFDLPPRPVDAPLPMSMQPLGSGVDEVCDDVLQYVGNKHHTRPYLERIIASYRDPSATVGSAFTAAIAELLGPSGLLIADAADPFLKSASIPTLRRALVDAGTHEAALVERTNALREAGYGTQVTILERGVNLFLDSGGGRERLYRRGEGFVVRERPGTLARDELLGMLETNPGSFSPNVLLRPVVESAVFPTLAYVGGPGEINYFAQVISVFQAMEVAPPVVVPRFAATVVGAGEERILRELELTESELVAPREVLLERLARREIPAGVDETLRSIRESWTEGFSRLMREGEDVDPTLVNAIGAIRNRGLLETSRVERKIVRAVKRKEFAAKDRLNRVLDSLRPGGSPQDRVLNVLPFLARMGPDFLLEVERVIQDRWPLPTGG